MKQPNATEARKFESIAHASSWNSIKMMAIVFAALKLWFEIWNEITFGSLNPRDFASEALCDIFLLAFSLLYKRLDVLKVFVNFAIFLLARLIVWVRRILFRFPFKIFLSRKTINKISAFHDEFSTFLWILLETKILLKIARIEILLTNTFVNHSTHTLSEKMLYNIFPFKMLWTFRSCAELMYTFSTLALCVANFSVTINSPSRWHRSFLTLTRKEFSS